MASPEVYSPRLNWFVDQMRYKLVQPRNQAKGDWRETPLDDLHDLLRMECDELSFEIDGDIAETGYPKASPDLDKIILEAADVANLAMMVADKARSMQNG